MDPPAIDDKGGMVLLIFKHHEILAGEELRYSQIITTCAQWDWRTWRTNDVADGIDLGIERGWFERKPYGSIKLNEAGFQAMQEAAPREPENLSSSATEDEHTEDDQA